MQGVVRRRGQRQAASLNLVGQKKKYQRDTLTNEGGNMVITRPLRSNEEMRDTCTREDPDADKESGKSEGIWWTGGERQSSTNKKKKKRRGLGGKGERPELRRGDGESVTLTGALNYEGRALCLVCCSNYFSTWTEIQPQPP